MTLSVIPQRACKNCQQDIGGSHHNRLYCDTCRAPATYVRIKRRERVFYCSDCGTVVGWRQKRRCVDCTRLGRNMRAAAAKRKARVEKPEMVKASKQRYADKHPDMIAAGQKRYQERAKADGRKAAGDRRYNLANPEKRMDRKFRYRVRVKELATALPKGWKRDQLKRQGGKCAGCQGRFSRALVASIDHIIPVSVGGLHEPANLQLLCMPCNTGKHTKPEAEWRREKFGALL